MATLRHSGVIAASALLVAASIAGCASGENTSPGDTFATGQLNGGDRNTVPQVTYITSPDSAPTGPAQIDVKVGTDSSPTRVEKARAGSPIQINLTNPAAADTFQIQGVGLERKVAADETATFNFTIAAPGKYSVLSKVTNTVLVVIEVD
jgi:hypothetical protein